jgi:hypothetical protein
MATIPPKDADSSEKVCDGCCSPRPRLTGRRSERPERQQQGGNPLHEHRVLPSRFFEHHDTQRDGQTEMQHGEHEEAKGFDEHEEPKRVRQHWARHG